MKRSSFKTIGKRAASLLLGAVLCASAASVQAFAVQTEEQPAGAACSVNESGETYTFDEQEDVLPGGLYYGENKKNDGTGAIYKYDGTAKRLVIPETGAGLTFVELCIMQRESDEYVLEFENNTVEEIVIPASVTLVYNSFLDSFKALKTITVAEGNEKYFSYDGVLYSKDDVDLQYYPQNKGGKLCPPKEWQGKVYDTISRIKSITLDKDTVLSEWDFFDLSYMNFFGVEEIQIDPNNSFGLKNIDKCIAREKDGAVILWSCPYINGDTFTIPEGVTDVEAAIFSVDTDNYPLKKLIFPTTYDPQFEFIHRGYIYGSIKITDFEVAPGNPKYKSIDGVVYDKSGETIVAVPAGRTGTFEIPAGVKAIGDCAFYDCLNFFEITIPDGVEKLGSYAIGECDNLKRLILPDSVTSIDYYGIAKNASLEYLELPESVRELGEYCFADCESLKAVKIPETVDDFYKDSVYKHTFDNSPVTICCVEGSAAEDMAKNENIPYVSIEKYAPIYNVPDMNTLGDVDYSGDVTAQDALMTLRASINLDKLTADQTTRADTNLDGVIAAEDALDILRVSLGFRFSLFT